MTIDDRDSIEFEPGTTPVGTPAAAHRPAQGGTAAGTPPADCDIAYCGAAGSHVIVLERRPSGRRRERYCAAHVSGAADDARADPSSELVAGPVQLG